MEPSLDNYWSLSPETNFRLLSSTSNGLTASDADSRLQQYGSNTLKAKSSSSGIVLFLSQFKSPITILLIAAAILSMVLGDFTDAIIILIIILISSFLGFWQEKGAANAVEEFLKMVQIRCRILRDGTENEWPIEKVVPGDIVFYLQEMLFPVTA